ncbi:hypothetical protein LTS14_010833 [Recurvomyces mirabilis]|nr:hypothetical protein LTS14_010833 [Recurvomyces mirabilis]
MSHAGFRNDDAEHNHSSDDSEKDDLPRTSEEVRRHDAETLTAEEDAERLLVGGSNAQPSQSGWKLRKEQKSRRSKRRRDGQEPEKRKLIYDTEEGGLRESSVESSSDYEEKDALQQTKSVKRSSKRRTICGFAVVHVVIVLAFLALLYGAWRASHTQRHPETNAADSTIPAEDEEKEQELPIGTTYKPQAMFNGTHTFDPTTILISLDGFRADFLQRHISPTLTAFVQIGVSPRYMLPSFPSLTFPNHFTLVTGLHPESHGVVGNTFWDPETEREFYYTDPERSMQPEWWQAEPLWVTAENAGRKTAVHMWPGSEVKGGADAVGAAYVDHYNGNEHLDNKVSRILGWLDLPAASERLPNGNTRPQLIAAYVPNVDVDGHKYGPNSTYIRSTIMEVDGMLNSLFEGLEKRNLTNIVNIVIVSDHGMSTTSVKRLIQIEDLVDTSLIEHTDGWPLYGLRPYDHSPSKLQEIYQGLIAKSKLPKYEHTFDVYLRDEDMPARYHFASSTRIAPLWIVPKAGWAIVTKEEFDIAGGAQEVYHPRGLHGYDNQHPLMRAIFVAKGPAFPHLPGSEVEPFQNTEVYNIVCDSLGIEPVPNNGTLRLPLKTSGVHDPDRLIETPEDLQDDPSLALPPEVANLAYGHGGVRPSSEPPVVPNLANRPDFMVPTAGIPPVETAISEPEKEAPQPVKPTETSEPARPVVHDGLDDDEKSGSINRWWEWVNGKIDAIKGWASNMLGKGDTKDDGGGDGES